MNIRLLTSIVCCLTVSSMTRILAQDPDPVCSGDDTFEQFKIVYQSDDGANLCIQLKDHVIDSPAIVKTCEDGNDKQLWSVVQEGMLESVFSDTMHGHLCITRRFNGLRPQLIADYCTADTTTRFRYDIFDGTFVQKDKASSAIGIKGDIETGSKLRMKQNGSSATCTSCSGWLLQKVQE